VVCTVVCPVDVVRDPVDSKSIHGRWTHGLDDSLQQSISCHIHSPVSVTATTILISTSNWKRIKGADSAGGARAYNEGLGAEPPAGPRSIATGQGSGQKPPEAKNLLAFRRPREGKIRPLWGNFSVLFKVVQRNNFLQRAEKAYNGPNRPELNTTRKYLRTVYYALYKCTHYYYYYYLRPNSERIS